MATSTATDEEIVTLERAYWDAMKENDTDAALSMSHDPCIVTGPQGAATVDHRQMRAMNDDKTWSLTDYKIDNMQVQTIGDDVAVLGYTIKLDMTVEGKALSMDCAESSAWVKRDGKWLCVLHSEAVAGDPYGRDKK